MRHFQSKESIRLADAVRQAINRFAGTGSLPLAVPSNSSAPRITTLAPACGQSLPLDKCFERNTTTESTRSCFTICALLW